MSKTRLDLDDEEDIDPRIHIELERLNTATDLINRLERDLDAARGNFRALLCDSTSRLDALSKRLGSCIEKSRPYYTARFQISEATKEAHEAAYQYEKANSAHSAAREMVYLAEQGLGGQSQLDPAWQEMLNHATQRVNESETARARANIAQMLANKRLQEKTIRVQKLQKELKKSIAKSRPYFEMKAQLNYQLELQKNKVQLFEKKIQNAKLSYAEALNSLERISDEIHKTRGMVIEQSNSKEKDNAQINKNSKENFVKFTKDENQKGQKNALNDPLSPCLEQNSTVYYNQTYIPDNYQRTYNFGGNSFTISPKLLSPTKPNPVKSSTWNNYSKEKLKRDNILEQAGIPSKKSENNFSKELEIKNNLSSKTTENSNKHNSSSSEWTEIDLDSSSPEEINNQIEIPYQKLNNLDLYMASPQKERNLFETWPSEESKTKSPNKTQPLFITSPKKEQQELFSNCQNLNKPNESEKLLNEQVEDKKYENCLSSYKLIKQITLPESYYKDIKLLPSNRNIKLESNISNWISRSAIKDEEYDSSRRQSLDNLLGPTSEKVKNIFSHGMMMLNINSLTERRNSEPKLTYDHASASCTLSSPSHNPITTNSNNIRPMSFSRKIPSPLGRTFNYLSVNNTDDDNSSDTDSIASSCDMLTDEQIQNLMLDKDIDMVCEKLLGTPLNEFCNSYLENEVKNNESLTVGENNNCEH